MLIFPMSLAMKTKCEKCGKELGPEGVAFICTFECTFCAECSAEMGITFVRIAVAN